MIPAPETASTTSSPKTEPASDTLAAAVAKPEGKADAPVVPDKYEFKLPEGYELPKEVEDKVVPIFKKAGFTNEQAQEFLDLHNEIAKEAAEAPVKFYEKMRSDWRTEVIGDRQIGDGRDGLSTQAKQDINAAFQAIGSERLVNEFKEAMNLTGAGDNPAFLRAFAALGKHFREGTAVAGTKPSPAGQTAPGRGPRSAASAMYPNLPSAS